MCACVGVCVCVGVSEIYFNSPARHSAQPRNCRLANLGEKLRSKKAGAALEPPTKWNDYTRVVAPWRPPSSIPLSPPSGHTGAKVMESIANAQSHSGWSQRARKEKGRNAVGVVGVVWRRVWEGDGACLAKCTIAVSRGLTRICVYRNLTEGSETLRRLGGFHGRGFYSESFLWFFRHLVLKLTGL